MRVAASSGEGVFYAGALFGALGVVKTVERADEVAGNAADAVEASARDVQLEVDLAVRREAGEDARSAALPRTLADGVVGSIIGPVSAGSSATPESLRFCPALPVPMPFRNAFALQLKRPLQPIRIHPPLADLSAGAFSLSCTRFATALQPRRKSNRIKLAV